MRVPCVIEFPCDSGLRKQQRPLGRMCLYRKAFACVLFDAKPTDDVNERGNNSLHPATVKQYIGTFPSTLGMGEFATSLSSIYTPLLQWWILQKPHHTHTHGKNVFELRKGLEAKGTLLISLSYAIYTAGAPSSRRCGDGQTSIQPLAEIASGLLMHSLTTIRRSVRLDVIFPDSPTCPI